MSADDYADAILPAVRSTGLTLVLEPGRALVGPAGVLVTEVVDLKRRPSGGWFVITDAGMTDLLRPALYGAWHAIEPVQPRPGLPWRVDVVGPVCETSDTLGADRELPPVEVGDLLAVRDTGAYGAVMASNYNRRPMAAEVLVTGSEWARRPAPPDRRRDADVGRMMLIAFEGLDQSGKETQARHVRARIEQAGRKVSLLSFPDYGTPIGQEIEKALHGEREFGPDVMQLLYVANRIEYKPRLDLWLADGHVVVCDRYRASSVAYGEAQGLDPAWLEDIQRHLPAPDVTMLLDIAPETAVAPQGQRVATATSATSRCSGASATATGARPADADWVVIDAEHAEG